MASQVPFKKNTAANVGLCLYKNDGTLIANPGTLTAKISKDFGDYADIGTVTEEDSTYGQIKLALTNTEMNADVVMLYVVDNTSGCVPWTATIYTAATRIDDLPAAAANADAVWDEARSGHTTSGTFGEVSTTADVADGVLDEVVEGAVTVRQMLRGIASALLSKVSGAGTATITFRDIGDTKNRIVATVDTDGNRSAVTLTLT